MDAKLDIFQHFKLRFGNDVHSELKALKFCQNEKECFLEIEMGDSDPEKKKLRMDFISGDSVIIDEKRVTLNYFRPEMDIVDNARNFLEFDDYSMIHCFGELLTTIGTQRINDAYWREKSNI